MDSDFLQKIYARHWAYEKIPTADEVGDFFTNLMGTLYPEFARKNLTSRKEFDWHVADLQQDLHRMLCFPPNTELEKEQNLSARFWESIPKVYAQLQEDIDAIEAGDPAADSRSEVIRSYPGFVAVAAYRFANVLHKLGVKIIPRMITEFAHSKTGVDIHPGATIGSHFCIDHGTGIVIGETTHIGNHVKLYQGVTLGALSVNKEDASLKRHPTIEDHVVIYAGASILGGQTLVGHHSIVGGNVWLTRSVPPHSKNYYRSEAENG
ncbi:MAG: serine acetyltransferase [Bacteroidia bacterium]|nr:serine acetyltransferase [Bacteroidia bacterium]